MFNIAKNLIKIEQKLLNNIKIDYRETKQTPPSNPKIQIRYPITKTFNIKRPVFIGNKAIYAAYALEGGKIQVFVQGTLGKLINKHMKKVII